MKVLIHNILLFVLLNALLTLMLILILEAKTVKTSIRILTLSETSSISRIWTNITNSLEGKLDDKNSNVWYSADFGKKYRNTITKLICDKFGAEADHKERGNNLVFDIDKLTKMGKIYRNNSGIKTIEKTDSLTHLDHTSRRGLNESSLFKKFLTSDSARSLSSRDGQNESVSQPKKKCPYCEYEEDPFFLKVHLKYTHQDQGNGT